MSDQQPDTKPGAYYVSMFDQSGNNGSGRVAYLAGPFMNDHARALALVDQAREMAYGVDPRSHWYSFGTCRMDTAGPVGKLNSLLGVQS